MLGQSAILPPPLSLRALDKITLRCQDQTAITNGWEVSDKAVTSSARFLA